MSKKNELESRFILVKLLHVTKQTFYVCVESIKGDFCIQIVAETEYAGVTTEEKQKSLDILKQVVGAKALASNAKISNANTKMFRLVVILPQNTTQQ